MTKFIVLFCSCCAFFTMNANAQTYFPNNVSKQKCSLSQQEFNAWFTDGSVSKDGKVWPADSAGFPTNNTRCDFYKWSTQMFLWLTSPSQSDGGGDYVFDSLIFYDVSPKYTINVTTTGRKLISNDVGNNFGLRSAKQDEPFTGEVGQAGGSGVLLSQPSTTVSTSNSLVYYGVHVNDVYAAFLKSQATAVTPAKDFPTTITSQLPDALALTMEVKTSWIDAATVSDATQYITIQAEVPKYVPNADNTLWVLQPKQFESKSLALVGMHIVGTVQGHPEMVWSTMEHVNNTANNSYTYLDTAGDLVTLPAQAGGNWLFRSATGTPASSNTEYAHVIDDNIAAKSPYKIVASDTTQMNPWGNASASTEINSDNNAQIISLDNDIIGFLKAGDVRKNYFLTGAVWTQHGGIPGQNPNAKQIGSLSLANSTMETYHQYPKTNFPVGCFACHGTSQDGVKVSHIYDDILNWLKSTD